MCSEQYSRSFDRKVVYYCAPTLCNIKPGCLFTCCDLKRMYYDKPVSSVSTSERWANLEEARQICAAKLEGQGVRVEQVASTCNGPLIYVYRPEALARYLSNPMVSEFLAAEGYEASSVDACVERLRLRFAMTFARDGKVGLRLERRHSDCTTPNCGTRNGCEFPHEIGLFLGYPFEDVVGFIENHGRNSKYAGCWKVYSSVSRAKLMFEAYRHCTERCMSMFDGGADICQIAVPGNSGYNGWEVGLAGIA